MKSTFLSTAAAATLLSILIPQSIQAQDINPPADIPTKPKLDKTELKKVMSYGLGFQNGENFASYGFAKDDFDQASFIKGLLAALSQKDMDVDPDKYDQAMKMIDTVIHKRELEIAKKNQQEELAFMEKNAKRKEVTTTASGLQYEVLKKGTGKSYTPPADSLNGVDNVTEFLIACTGSMLNGSQFIETPEGKPIVFNLQVIQGFAEALKAMPIGAKWKIYVPAKLAFGLQRQGAKIEPNSMLIYEIELFDITKKEADPSQSGTGIPGHPLMPSGPHNH